MTLRPADSGAVPLLDYRPLVAWTSILRRGEGHVAYDCVRVMVIREGSAILSGEFGQRPVSVGDVILLAPNVPCGGEPEGRVLLTTVCLDTNYALEQVFWQHSALLSDRLAASSFAAARYTEPFQIIRLGENAVDALAHSLDEIESLSRGPLLEHFHRMQELWSGITHKLDPLISVSPVPMATARGQRAHIRPTLPRWRRFAPVRDEVRTVEALMRNAIAEPWPLSRLADHAHLSTAQLSHLFVRSYGKTPWAYLTMLRVEELARLMRETNLTTEAAARQVGWADRDHASQLFRRYVGVTPSRYRRNGPPLGSTNVNRRWPAA
ncbi:helix-turn-helix domain-containing protein [Micropruina sonneratiae]|uniref:helix-turn-helix domain-containing protein n=1 Tax=Micropruina sonneratiae TaxID=2986940 RepID=UPI002225CF0F|nr:AraC family transcriptional regulator [Micropruina sp. KQZ13P-5]MCW3158381.1 AraC family transcriptional regulator [Micropruina sp. KQZ13P-5]